MKFNLGFLLLSIFLSFGFFKVKTLNDNDRLIKAVTSEKFNDFFRVCEIKNDTIKIFHNFDNFAIHQFVKLNCGKILEIERKITEVDINTSYLSRPKFMVLHKFENRKRKYEFSFLDVHTNGNLILVFNKKNILVEFRGGSF
jgi:hypothetical protein